MNDKNDACNSNTVTQGIMVNPEFDPISEPQQKIIGLDPVPTIAGSNDGSHDLAATDGDNTDDDAASEKPELEVVVKTKRSHLAALLIPTIIVYGYVAYLFFSTADSNPTGRQRIEFISALGAFFAVTFGVVGSYIAALAEVNPQQHGKKKAWGAITRFWGSMLGFAVLFIALVILV